MFTQARSRGGPRRGGMEFLSTDGGEAFAVGGRDGTQQRVGVALAHTRVRTRVGSAA